LVVAHAKLNKADDQGHHTQKCALLQTRPFGEGLAHQLGQDCDAPEEGEAQEQRGADGQIEQRSLAARQGIGGCPLMGLNTDMRREYLRNGMTLEADAADLPAYEPGLECDRKHQQAKDQQSELE